MTAYAEIIQIFVIRSIPALIVNCPTLRLINGVDISEVDETAIWRYAVIVIR